MIKLEQIAKSDDVISCVAYIEDSKEPMTISYNYATDKLDHSDFPKGYEYCKTHVWHARKQLIELYQAEKLPKTWKIMWC